MAYNTYDAPYLSSYDDAVKWYENTKPIRGQTVRPLGNRRYHMYASIERQEEKVVLVYEKFPCVIWRPENLVTVIAPQYYNAFQADKMMGMLPRGCGFEWNGGRLFVTTDHGSNKHYLPRGGSLVLKEDGKTLHGIRRYTCVDAEIPLEYRMRRGMQGKLVEKHFTPFLSWVRVVLDENARLKHPDVDPAYERFLTELGYSEEQLKAHQKAVEQLDHTSAYRGQVYRFLGQLTRLPFPTSGELCFSRPACELMFSRISTDDATHWPDMLMIIRKRAGRYHWGNGVGGYVTTYDDVVDYLKDLVSFLFHEKVFEVERLGPGQIPSKRNAHYKHEVAHIF